jgi:hypothetical protein
VRAFNSRIRSIDGAVDFFLPENEPTQESDSIQSEVQSQQKLALDGTEVRGGVFLVDLPAWVGGQQRRLTNFQSPLSEGVVARKYGYVGPKMIDYVRKRNSLCYAVGMGSLDRPLPRLLLALKWHVHAVPFLFRVESPSRVVRQLRLLQKSPATRLVSRILASTGLAWTGTKLLQARAVLSRVWNTGDLIEPVTSWGDWVAPLWTAYRQNCSFAFSRDHKTLGDIYPLREGRLIAYRISTSSRIVGWSVCLNTQMNNHKYFGSMRVATILDCVSVPGHFASVIDLTARELSRMGADLIIANHSHALWQQAMKRSGFLEAKSNFLLATTPELSAAIEQSGGWMNVHVTRGDGDGRIHL